LEAVEQVEPAVSVHCNLRVPARDERMINNELRFVGTAANHQTAAGDCHTQA
jgi:hypothetical protein